VIDWPLAISTASQALKFAYDLRSIDREVSRADLKLKLADLAATLADLKATLVEARSDATEKEDEIVRLKKRQALDNPSSRSREIAYSRLDWRAYR
jgi:hypothetical protein